MGAKQSKLKKELATLKAQAALAKAKHDEDLEALKSDKRVLEFKLSVLQELTAQAQLEAEKATQAALESDERMKALKWELVRKLTVFTASNSTVSSASARSSATSLATSESSTPRVALNWKLRDGVVALRRSSTTMLPSSGSKPVGATQRPHAQSEPVMPQKQTLATKQEPKKVRDLQDPEAEMSTDAASRSTIAKQGDAKPVKSTSSDNNEEKEDVHVGATTATALQPMAAPSSASSSETESKSKYPAISRKRSAQGLQPKPSIASRREESKSSVSDNDREAGKSSSSSESESGERRARAAPKQAARGASGDDREEGTDRELEDSRHPRERKGEGNGAAVLAFSEDEESS